MSQARYRVVNLPNASAQLREILVEAAREGRLDRVVTAGELMHHELEMNPTEFGESRYFLEASQLSVRIGFESSLYSIIGIHAAKRIVFVFMIGWRKGRSENY